MSSVKSVHVNPDTKHILSATATDVILLGRDGDEFETCIALVPRETYLAAVVAWLDYKARYFKHTREFAGAGYIRFTDPKPTDKSFHLNEYPDDDGEVIVRTIRPSVFTATVFEIEMEHG